jgi:hypothetical protein
MNLTLDIDQIEREAQDAEAQAQNLEWEAARLRGVAEGLRRLRALLRPAEPPPEMTEEGTA